jgi:vancomycin resistance protein YoaR
MLDDATSEDSRSNQRFSIFWRSLGVILVAALLVAASFELVYAGKVFPGVRADGVSLGGLGQNDVASHLTDATTQYATAVLPVSYGNTTLHIPLNSLALKYDTAKASSLAYSYGRTGDVWRRLHEQLRALTGRDTNFAAYSYDDTQLTPYLSQVSDDVSSVVTDATLSFNDNHAQVTPAQDGQRLDLGMMVSLIESHLATTSLTTVPAPVYALPAVVSTTALTSAIPQVDTALAAPITLTESTGDTRTIDQLTIASWVKITAHPASEVMDTHLLGDFYPMVAPAKLAIDQAAVSAYVATLASQINQSATNAQLSMQNNVLTVVKPSQNGAELDQTGVVKAISDSLTTSEASRTVALSIKTTQATVRQDNLADLGIVEQLSEGETYFPGSPSTRLINVRAGASKFNGVLLAPGEQFSFGKLLGQVDASTGYVPELVILGDHEEKQYGGGLCQVSSTAFRAALAAGLPINERVNHAFAISYYTWPYSAPGVDATIYYPEVDFKFTNDTGHYLLMQTTMSGVDLKFDFYGTRIKTGAIRGPNFVTGSSDPKVPSHTVFYRDVMDLSGNITKTDTFNTYYKSSSDFPITKQFN